VIISKFHKKGEKLERILIGLFVCPLSGFAVGGRIRVHAAEAMYCRGGNSIFYVCNVHKVRGFVNDRKIVKRCRDAEKEAVSDSVAE